MIMTGLYIEERGDACRKRLGFRSEIMWPIVFSGPLEFIGLFGSDWACLYSFDRVVLAKNPSK